MEHKLQISVESVNTEETEIVKNINWSEIFYPNLSPAKHVTTYNFTLFISN